MLQYLNICDADKTKSQRTHFNQHTQNVLESANSLETKTHHKPRLSSKLSTQNVLESAQIICGRLLLQEEWSEGDDDVQKCGRLWPGGSGQHCQGEQYGECDDIQKASGTPGNAALLMEGRDCYYIQGLL